MTTPNTVDAARVELLLSELRLPGVKLRWAKLAEQSDKEGWPAARFFGASGKLARENAMRNPARTATTAAALMIGVALVTFVAVLAPLLIGVLKGAFIFLSDLVRQITRPLQVDFLVASSYGDGMVSTGTVNLVYDPETELAGKDILLVEDIIDSGRTLNRLMAILKERRPRSLEICALLHKRIAEGLRYNAKFVGFDAPNEFLVGYGLDHAENFRHLPYIASLQ